MKLREAILKDVEALDASDVLALHGVIVMLKAHHVPSPASSMATAYLKVRRALRSCAGSLGDDVIQMRDDRI
jgi:hypothetical protein